MPDFAGALGASKAASALLVLFIPSKDRRNKPIDQRVLGQGGAERAWHVVRWGNRLSTGRGHLA